MAKWVEDSGRTRAYLLGVQPESLKAAAGLTPAVQTTLELLGRLISEIMQDEKKRVDSCSNNDDWLDGRTEATAPNTEVTV